MKTRDLFHKDSTRYVLWQFLLVLLFLLPLLLLFVLPARGSISFIAFWLGILLIVNLVLAWLILRGRTRVVEAAPAPSPPHLLGPEEMPAAIHDIMDVEQAAEDNGIQVFRGHLREPPESAYERLKQLFPTGTVPMLQEDRAGAAILLVPRPIERSEMETRTRPWLHWLLFALTMVTTTWAGALHQGINLLHDPAQFAVGLPYSVGLLSILGFHELGHYFTARHYNMRVTPPYFIPVPFALGTFGAFIQMRSPAENRRSLFDVAIAGPWAGLILCIPALIIGLRSSTVIPINGDTPADAMAGPVLNVSVLFGLIAKLALGSQLDGENLLRMSPLAFAGWLGLLVTALNLMPIGQLDGGHMARAMFGDRVGTMISRATMWGLFILALFVWPSLLFWAVIVFFLARRTSPPLNDVTPVSLQRKVIGIISFIVLALILIPMPKSFW